MAVGPDTSRAVHVLLLPCHEQTLLILLLEQHQLHLIILQGMIATIAATLSIGRRDGCGVLLHGDAAVGIGVELGIRPVHADLVHRAALCAAGAHVGVDALVYVRLIVHILHRSLHLLLDGLRVVHCRLRLLVSR